MRGRGKASLEPGDPDYLPPKSLIPGGSVLPKGAKVPAAPLSSSWGLQLTDFHGRTLWCGWVKAVSESKLTLQRCDSYTCPGPGTAGIQTLPWFK